MSRPAGDGPALFAAPDAYERHMGRYSRELCDPFIALAGVSAGTRVLDVGCGTGVLTSALAQRLGAALVAAVDPSEAFVGVCRNRVPGAQILVADAESLPFPGRRFDAVLSQLVVNFMKDPSAGVGEMRRVVRTGGVVAGCVWDYGGGMTLLRSFWDAAIELALPGARDHDQGRTMRFCSPHELAGLWVGAGASSMSKSASSSRTSSTKASTTYGPHSRRASRPPAPTSRR